MKLRTFCTIYIHIYDQNNEEEDGLEVYQRHDQGYGIQLPNTLTAVKFKIILYDFSSNMMETHFNDSLMNYRQNPRIGESKKKKEKERRERERRREVRIHIHRA